MKKIDGQVVGNSAVPIRLKVTARDIREGAPLNPNACAIAVAIKRQVPGASDVFVHLGRVYIRLKGHWLRWETPEYATREIVAFDRGGKFIPQEIDLRPVSTRALMRKVAKIRGAASPARKRRKPAPRHYTEGVRDSAHADQPGGKRREEG